MNAKEIIPGNEFVNIEVMAGLEFTASVSSFMHAAVNCHAAKHKTRSRKFELALIYTGTIGEATSAMNDLWIFADIDIVPGVVADPVKEDLGEQVEKSESMKMKMIILYLFLCLHFC